MENSAPNAPIQKKRRCKGVLYGFKEKTAEFIVRQCRSRETIPVKILPVTAPISADATNFRECMEKELAEIVANRKATRISRKHNVLLFRDARSAYESCKSKWGMRIESLTDPKAYGGEISHFCDRCKRRYEKSHPEKTLEILHYFYK